MRTIANLLMWLGVALGAAVGIVMAAGLGAHGLPWLVTVGLIKLSLAGALGLIASGGVLLRLTNRAAGRKRLLESTTSDPERVDSGGR